MEMKFKAAPISSNCHPKVLRQLISLSCWSGHCHCCLCCSVTKLNWKGNALKHSKQTAAGANIYPKILKTLGDKIVLKEEFDFSFWNLGCENVLVAVLSIFLAFMEFWGLKKHQLIVPKQVQLSMASSNQIHGALEVLRSENCWEIMEQLRQQAKNCSSPNGHLRRKKWPPGNWSLGCGCCDCQVLLAPPLLLQILNLDLLLVPLDSILKDWLIKTAAFCAAQTSYKVWASALVC